jgi:hypothetical protein
MRWLNAFHEIVTFNVNGGDSLTEEANEILNKASSVCEEPLVRKEHFEADYSPLPEVI